MRRPVLPDLPASAMTAEQLFATDPDERRYMHDPGERRMAEAELLVSVLRMCGARNLWVLHAHDSRTLARGWPDITVVSPFGTIFRELKTADGDLSKHQIYILRSMMRSGLDVAVWRPTDLLSGEIERQLDGLTREWQGSALQITCEGCGRKVIADKSRKRFCSDRCRERARYNRKRAGVKDRLRSSACRARPRLAGPCPATRRHASTASLA